MSTSNPSEVKKLVLLLGFASRKLGEDGRQLPAPSDRCTPDELRAQSFKNKMLHRDTRVMTVNKGKQPDNPFHFEAEFKTKRWVRRFNKMLQSKFPEVTLTLTP